MRTTIPTIEMLYKCADACDFAAHSLIDEPDFEELKDTMRSLKDCADISIITARLISRHSMYIHEAIRLCGKVCQDCAAECDNHTIEHCRKAAKNCREAAGTLNNFIDRGM